MNNEGYAIPSTRLVSAVQRHTSGTNNNTVPLPPPPNAHTNIMPPSVNQPPPVIDTTARSAGATFGRQGTRNPHTSDNHSVGTMSAVSINGRSYNGAVYDSSGNRIA